MTLLRRVYAFDRSQIIHAFLPFSEPHLMRGMVIGNDLDSVLSALFLKSIFGWDIKAIYDYQTLWRAEEETDFLTRLAQGQYLALDLDIYHPNIFSVGHHILEYAPADILSGHARSLNPNFIRGVGAENFKQKYPLGTIHFLVWLFHETNLTRAAKFLMWLADSAFINAQSHRFRANALDWTRNALQSDYLTEMTERVELPGFEEALRREILPRLRENPLAIEAGQATSLHLKMGGFQCQWSDPNRQRDAVAALFALAGELCGWNLPALPQKFLPVVGKRRVISAQEMLARYGSLDSFLAAEKVFSYVFPYRDSVNYSAEIL